jgi:hypothetical protein
MRLNRVRRLALRTLWCASAVATALLAAPALGQSCPPSDHNCFTTGSPGCTNVACCLAVCAQDSFCCTTSWDSLCVSQASTLCDGCGDPAAGDCCVSNGSPYCNNRTCCDAICAVDPFCCNNTWDQLCANQAQSNAACGCVQSCNGRIDFGVTPDDSGNPNACVPTGPIVITTQYQATQGIVFGTAVDNFGPAPVGILTDGACEPDCRSAGLPAYTTDWWCQFRFVDGTTAGVPVFSAELCFINGPAGTVLMEGYDNARNLIVNASNTTNGAETLTIVAPSGSLIAYVRVVASNPARPSGVTVDCLAYDGPFPRTICPASDHNCFTTGGPGCSNVDCCEIVCAIDAFCCNTAWDSLCTIQAAELCGGCGSPDAGCCFSSHTQNTGCNSLDCCLAVCAVDVFCCDVAWDGICASEAEILCAGCRADFNGDGFVDGADLGLLLSGWGTGDPCYDLNNDGTVNGGDLGLLLAAWGPCSI